MLKRRRLIALLISALATAAVARAPVEQGSARPGAAPQIGRFGVDETAMDKGVAPGEDFYRYVNGAWVARTTISAEQSGYGRMSALSALSDQRVRHIVEGLATSAPAGSAGEKIGFLYRDFMDEPGIERKGGEPLAPFLQAIAAIRSPADLARAFGSANRNGINVPFRFFVQQDLKDNTRNAAYVRQGGLGMPDREYYLSSDASFIATRETYRHYISTLLTLARWPAPDAAAERILVLESALAKAHWSAADDRDINKLYNPMPVRQLASTMPGVDWPALLDASGMANAATVVVFEPSALKEEARIVAATPLGTWKAYLAFHTIAAAAPYLSAEFVAADFAFNGKELSGTLSITPRQKRGLDMVNGAMGQAIGQLYVAAYFPAETKARIDTLVKNLMRAMDARLAANPWMSAQTRQQARTKLAALTLKIGYPEKWRDYGDLHVVPGDLVGNVFRSRAFEYGRRLTTLNQPVDRTEWATTPQTASAYSSAPMNDIVVPAAIFEPPYFDPAADPAVNYGAVGTVIAHEMSHNFDNRGAQFNAQGQLSAWWTPEDRARFDALGAKLASQYEPYEPLPGMHVNGQLTLSENMADLAGINVAYDAYHLSLGGQPAADIDGVSGDQRFFLGFAQLYRAKQRPEALREQLITDPHTPETVRVNVVRNLDAWYAAFDVKPHQTGYLAPSERIRIW